MHGRLLAPGAGGDEQVLERGAEGHLREAQVGIAARERARGIEYESQLSIVVLEPPGLRVPVARREDRGADERGDRVVWRARHGVGQRPRLQRQPIGRLGRPRERGRQGRGDRGAPEKHEEAAAIEREGAELSP